MMHALRSSLAAALLLVAALPSDASKPNVKGRVTADGRPLSGVLVSDGAQFVRTDRHGRYAMCSDKADSTVMVITPSGFVAGLVDGIRPGFWAMLDQPVDKCEVHDFNLRKEDQSSYTVYFAPDLHIGLVPHRHELASFRDILLPKVREWYAEDIASGPVYTLCLGDITMDKYWYRDGFNGRDGYGFIAGSGYPTPIYAVTGNHDNDGAVNTGESTDSDSAWVYRNCWGPDKYSVNIGGDHWIFMDDVYYINDMKGDPGEVWAHNYDCLLTDRQLAWLEKDLSYVPDDAQVYFCTHIPFVNSLVKGGLKVRMSDMDKVYGLFSRFTRDVVCYSGHLHRFDFLVHPDYPRYRQYSMPAASGAMWETREGYPIFGEDGCDAGMYIVSYKAGEAPRGRFETYRFGEKYYRVYDMNEVARFYAADESVAYQMSHFDKAEDFTAPGWANVVMVNYWAWEQGDTVEMEEDGRQLKVSHRKCVDPIGNFTYTISRAMRSESEGKPKARDAKMTLSHHMFRATAATPDHPVTIRIKDASGHLRYEETLIRPKPFSIDMR